MFSPKIQGSFRPPCRSSEPLRAYVHNIASCFYKIKSSLAMPLAVLPDEILEPTIKAVIKAFANSERKKN